MKKTIIIMVALFVITAYVHAANVAFNNYTTNSSGITGASALFYANGALVSDTLTNNIKIGYFNLSDAAIEQAWNAGDLMTLNSSFVLFDTTGMGASGMAGVVDTGTAEKSEAFTTPFVGENIYVWISSGTNFTDLNAEYLIFKSDGLFKGSDYTGTATLDPNMGTLLVGEYGNYYTDFEAGVGNQYGFNLVAAVPEPSSWAMLVGGIGLLLWRKRRRLSAV